MQIKFYCKMAKNDSLLTFCANIVQENERMLRKLCCKNQIDIKSMEKLFNKLNYICQMRSAKEEVQLNSSWSNKNVTSYIYGPILGFPSGSWWGIRMDCSRDRVHDPFDETIQNGPFGVTSVCTSSSNLNEDVDFGNSLTITGQKYLNGKLDKDPLIKNYENQIPVRLIRSYNLLNEFAPKTGYRYDGLYIVTKFWIGVNSDSTKHYKFALLRLNNQEPPLWSNKPAPIAANNVISMPMPSQSHLKNSSPNVYEFKRYSHGSESVIQKGKHENSNGFLQFTNIENKRILEKEKGTFESAIVTRHVFKKVNTNTECVPNLPNVSVTSENKSLTHIGSQGSKAHSTNISIRTGLYDSSHNTQNDNKKNILSPLCRTAKPLNTLKTNQHMETWNLSTKDKNRNLDGKMHTVASNECPKRVNYISFNTAKVQIKPKVAVETNSEESSNSNDISSSFCNKPECNVTHKETASNSEEISNNTVDSSDTATNMLNMMNCMYKNEIPAHRVISKEEQELNSFDSLDSLTPDKILHLIKNKGNPLSKLLMGNMIGLTSEQTRALQTQGTVTVESEIEEQISQKNSTEEIKEKRKFEGASDDLNGLRCYKFRRRRRLSRKIINVTEKMKCNKIHNKKLKNGVVQSSDVSHYSRNMKQNQVQKGEPNSLQHSSKSIKNNIGDKREGIMHLRTVRASNSSIKKHVTRKKRREIMNLLIDAKIGPKIRGPRYRRLRCINNTYAKEADENFNSTICMINKRKINSERSTFTSKNKLTKTTSCKSVKDQQGRSVSKSETLNLKREKVDREFTISAKKIDKDYVAKRLLNNNNNENDDNNKRSKFIEDNTKVVDNKSVAPSRNRKRKLTENYAKAKADENEGSKPCKTDAVTQCSLIREPLMRKSKSSNCVQNNARNEQHTFIKIEYGDLKDMKCEAMKSDDENNRSQSKSQSDEKYVSCIETVYNVKYPKDPHVSVSNNILNTEERNTLSAGRVSAFVPVNIPDNDVKIARLRSIGFKPIDFNNSSEDANSRGKESGILKRDVAEKYDKYTNEENDIVVYMDDELQYQDIENEDKNSLPVKCKIPESKVHAVKGELLNKMILEKESCDSLFEQELESPWHGWKKVVTNKDTYWVGW